MDEGGFFTEDFSTDLSVALTALLFVCDACFVVFTLGKATIFEAIIICRKQDQRSKLKDEK